MSGRTPVPAAREAQEGRGGACGRAALWCTISLLFLLLLVLLASLSSVLGLAALLMGGVAALVPLGIVLIGVHLADRWDPVPWESLGFAFLWGAAASVALTLLMQFVLTGVVGSASNGVVAAVVSAPIIEEGSKALGVLLVFWLFRSHYDGAIDGVVFAMTIGAGFAFTENSVYFGETHATGETLLFTAAFLTRGLLSPFAHALFTSCVGLWVGWAIARGRHPEIWGILGLVLAIALHAVWNLSTLTHFTVLYLLFHIPFFVMCVLGMWQLLRRERRLTELCLGELVSEGWLTPGEVRLLGTDPGRAQLRRRARARGSKAMQATNDLLREATRLAMLQRRLRNRPESVSCDFARSAQFQWLIMLRDQLFVLSDQ